MTQLLEIVHLVDKEMTPRRTRDRIAINFQEKQSEDVVSQFDRFLVSIFKSNGYQVLIKHLAVLWNYPSSYQLVSKFVKHIGPSVKNHIKKTTSEMNEGLLSKGFIKESEKSQQMFYIDLEFLYTCIENKNIFFEIDQESKPLTYSRIAEDEKITVNQVFPQYGMVDTSIEMSHSFFNSLNQFSKLNYYKDLPNSFKFLPNSKLTFAERELILKENDFSEVSLDFENGDREKTIRKPVGKARKYVTDFDPNSIDLQDSVIPGQGYIQEFNVNHICKVPNYYTTINQSGSSSSLNLKKNLSSSSMLFNDNVKLSKNVQQLVYNNDGDNFNYSKYFYSRNYRGPGSGNYKDTTLINKVNKITLSSKKLNSNHRISKDINRAMKRRHTQNIKGLTYDTFNKDLVHTAVSEDLVDDFRNLEMLHNNLQFNLLLNTYRSISEDTWDKYYEFKLSDFEQLGQFKNRNDQPLLRKFTMPFEHNEILQSLPIDLRDGEAKNEQIPSIKKPIYYTSAAEDPNNLQILNKIDIIKFPNANSIGWDNIRKFKHDQAP